MQLLKRAPWLLLLAFLLNACLTDSQPVFPQQVRQVALTFDDLPLSGPKISVDELGGMTADILYALELHGAPATGLVNEVKLEVPGETEIRTALLKRWLEAGADLGNHTYSHPNLNETDVEDFLKDIQQGERVTRDLMASAGKELRYFRHPYLRTGLTIEVRERVRSFLSEQGYQVAPVTLENVDWIFNVALLEARKQQDPHIEDRVKEAYLDFTDEMFTFFEDAAQKVLGRPIRHVLLLHANPMNGLALGELLDRLEKRGYEFISLEYALQDPAYSRPENYLGRAGVNWIFRWDVEDGERVVDWTLEPQPPNFVDKLYRGNP